MKELMFFMLPNCPHCRLAKKFIAELTAERPEYRDIAIREIDESREKLLADSYDYFLVPSFFLGEKKLHEGHAEKADIERVLNAALGRN